MEKDIQIQNIVRELSSEKDTAAMAFTDIDGRIGIAVAGTPSDLTMLIAKAVSKNPKLGEFIEASLQAAPLVGILFGTGESTATCDCPKCTAMRAEKATDPSVN